MCTSSAILSSLSSIINSYIFVSSLKRYTFGSKKYHMLPKHLIISLKFWLKEHRDATKDYNMKIKRPSTGTKLVQVMRYRSDDSHFHFGRSISTIRSSSMRYKSDGSHFNFGKSIPTVQSSSTNEIITTWPVTAGNLFSFLTKERIDSLQLLSRSILNQWSR